MSTSEHFPESSEDTMSSGAAVGSRSWSRSLVTVVRRTRPLWKALLAVLAIGTLMLLAGLGLFLLLWSQWE